MTEPSYYPLDVLESHRESLVSPPPEQEYRDVPDQPDPGFVEKYQDLQREGSQSSTYLAPLRPQLFHRGLTTHTRPSLWRVVKTPIKMALLPLAAIGYLAFCYSVHGMVIPVKTYGLYAVTPQHLATIKGGITSISIIIISIALYPVYDVISNVKSEEFFRVLSSHSHGVPLDTINHISTPSFGNVDTMVAIWRKGCSSYYILGMVALILTMVVATLAPGALTVGSVLADGDMVALAIGGVPPQSVINGSVPALQAYYSSSNSDRAASIAWAEIELDVQYSFGVLTTPEPDFAAYITPLPVNLDLTTNARWLTDVIGINPKCSWASTNLTQPVHVPFNETSAFLQYMATAYLVDFDLDVQVKAFDIPGIGNSPFAKVKDPTLYVTNHTTHAFPTDGSTVFLLGQCVSGCPLPSPINISINLGGLPTFTIALIDQTWSMAALVCLPNITIETREVRNEGQGFLAVQPRPVGRQLTPQRNLHPVQTTALFSIATMSLTSSAGPMTGNLGQYAQLGSQVQGNLLFGQQYDGLPGNDAPFGTKVAFNLVPIEDITKGYTQLIQSAAKSYLTSYLGTAYVPGRISDTEIVFAASMPNVAVSTAVFALLAALLILAHFRPGKGVEFTLVNVVAAVHGSELPAQFAQMKAEQTAIIRGHAGEDSGNVDVDRPGETDDVLHNLKGRHVGGDQHDITEMLRERKIFMQSRVDGAAVLHIS